MYLLVFFVFILLKLKPDFLLSKFFYCVSAFQFFDSSKSVNILLFIVFSECNQILVDNC